MSVRGKSGLPWAGDLPIAGHAFRNEPAHAEDRLVVLLEPTIIQSNETWNQDLRGVRQRLDGYRCMPAPGMEKDGKRKTSG